MPSWWTILGDGAQAAALADAAARRGLPSPRGEPSSSDASVIVVIGGGSTAQVDSLATTSAVVVALDDRSLRSSSIPRERLLGVGTVALASRFRRAIAKRLRIDARDVHATIVGSPDRPLPLWSSATVAAIPLHQWAVQGHGRMTVRDRAELFMSLSENASPSDEVDALLDVVEAILTDANRVLPVSSRVTNYRDIKEAWLALPCIVNAGGAEPPLEVAMNDAELAGVRQLAEEAAEVSP